MIAITTLRRKWKSRVEWFEGHEWFRGGDLKLVTIITAFNDQTWLLVAVLMPPKFIFSDRRRTCQCTSQKKNPSRDISSKLYLVVQTIVYPSIIIRMNFKIARLNPNLPKNQTSIAINISNLRIHPKTRQLNTKPSNFTNI